MSTEPPAVHHGRGNTNNKNDKQPEIAGIEMEENRHGKQNTNTTKTKNSLQMTPPSLSKSKMTKTGITIVEQFQELSG